MAATELESDEREALLSALEARFDTNMHRHEGLVWGDVQARLEARPDRLGSLAEMERTGGEPDVVGLDGNTGEFLFVDCTPESPAGRRSLCYDGEALEARKKNKPAGSAVGMAADMGVELLTEEQYRLLQRHNGAESYYAARGFRCVLRV